MRTGGTDPSGRSCDFQTSSSLASRKVARRLQREVRVYLPYTPRLCTAQATTELGRRHGTGPLRALSVIRKSWPHSVPYAPHLPECGLGCPHMCSSCVASSNLHGTQRGAFLRHAVIPASSRLSRHGLRTCDRSDDGSPQVDLSRFKWLREPARRCRMPA